ncbi:MAG: hypothetical protein JSW35_10750 [Deltaproteobacteria bacterium]|nr:MAG: hypothetical protein JSW35_10750 [Deltaproteobacteria bacterium]
MLLEKLMAEGIDVTRQSEVEGVFSRLVKDLGSPSILFNNAGVTQTKRITEITEADIV